jgi:hypothetical protein
VAIAAAAVLIAAATAFAGLTPMAIARVANANAVSQADTGVLDFAFRVFVDGYEFSTRDTGTALRTFPGRCPPSAPVCLSDRALSHYDLSVIK